MLLTSKLTRSIPGLWVVAFIASAITLGVFFRIEPVNIPLAAAETEKSAAASNTLRAGESSEGELGPAEEHAYQVNLEGGQYLRVLVNPVAFNLSLRLTAPDGRVMLELESRERERTPLSIIADKPGSYRLDMRSLETAGIRGRYKLQVTDVRESTARDAQTIDADKAFAAAEELLREWKAESSRTAIEKLRASSALWKAIGERG